MFDEGMPGEDPNKGWNRASVQYRSRRPYRPAVKADDLVMPNGLGNLRMLWACFLMGGIMTVLYVWIPLIFLNVFVPLSGVAYAAALGGALLGLTAILYVGGTRETRRDRELATRL
jgi:membrane associated rhomboid family serine protease